MYEVGEADGVPFLAMRYVAGRTLRCSTKLPRWRDASQHLVLVAGEQPCWMPKRRCG